VALCAHGDASIMRDRSRTRKSARARIRSHAGCRWIDGKGGRDGRQIAHPGGERTCRVGDQRVRGLCAHAFASPVPDHPGRTTASLRRARDPVHPAATASTHRSQA